MEFTWVNRVNSKRLILFFNGWGCDKHPFKHLKGDGYDVLMMYNYQNLAIDEKVLSALSAYSEINVMAWSYGVWVAQFVCEKYRLSIANAIAINGTSQPVDDKFGIAEAIVQGTLDHLSERNLMKFQRRMLGSNDAWKKFEKDKPQRDFEGQRQELVALIQYFKHKVSSDVFYHKAIVASNDLIFTASNQKAFWHQRAAVVKEIEAPHFCFYNYNTWAELADG